MADHDKKHHPGGIARPAPALHGGGSHRNGAGHRSPSSQGKESTQGAGWDAYRGWLSKMDSTAGRRRSARSIYTWKGYKAWAAKIRANWDADEADK